MDLFTLLGAFPLVLKIYLLFGFNVNFKEKNNDTLFFFLTVFFSLIWLFGGLFTEQWKIFLGMLVLNTFVLGKLDGVIFSKIKNLFVISVVILITLIRLKLIVWDL